MKHTMFALSFVMLATLAGCAESPPPAAPAEPEIGRDAAVTTARRDAAQSFHVGNEAAVAVSRSGRYWVVDLRTADGAVHYAIANDGSIRERRMVR